MAKQDTLPLLPYAGTSGWSGTDTSRGAALYMDTHGITATAQRGVVMYLLSSHRRGATVKEIRENRPNLGHHGRVSGALSILHKEGHISMLDEKRERCHVYVLPQFEYDRPIVPPKGLRESDGTAEVCPTCGSHVRPAR